MTDPTRPAGASDGASRLAGIGSRAEGRTQATGGRRFGVRARVTLLFALGALLLSITLSVLTYGLTRNYITRQRESLAVRQAYLNASVVRSGLGSAEPLPTLLGSLDTGPGSASVLLARGRWSSSSLEVGRDNLPVSLRRVATDGSPAVQRFDTASGPSLAVGVPIPSVDATYFEVADLSDLRDTLRVLGWSLFAAAAVTTVAGAAVGRWASGRTVRPLADVALAASSIAGGRLDTRLPDTNDPDVAEISVAFNRMADALEARIARDAAFTSDVSHELRSPLTTLAAAVEVVASRQPELSERARVALDLLRSEVERFTQMVQDLLEISRVDAGEEPRFEELRPAELVRRSVEGWRGAAVPVEVEPLAEGCLVLGDKRRLERVVHNLLANAERYADGATRIQVSRLGARIRISVDDAGPGVALEDRERIFERFARGATAHRRADTDGIGLGLALVAEHVRLHGGSVWVGDSPEGGARFVVELPVVETT